MDYVRIIGCGKVYDIRPRAPTQDEIHASVEAARVPMIAALRGVHRYRSHEEANAAMEKWVVDGLVQTAKSLA